ncbi:DUF3431 domain-containing protein [bacterium]|nr:DUF3431 domain-containing protein [bacterium]NBX48950.1 DUF3431 domain-containing protein [bacterium]
MNLSIVVARYDEDIRWIEDLPSNILEHVIIYNKGDPIKIPDLNVITICNVGRESHTYLTYIIDNYDHLPEHVIFIQANPFQHVHRPPIANMEEWIQSWSNVEISTNYEPTCDPYTFRIREYNGQIQSPAPTCFGKWFETYINRKYPDNRDMKWYFGACFGVSRERIHLRSKVYYQRLLDQVSLHKSPEVGHYLERSWYYIFSCRPEP